MDIGDESNAGCVGSGTFLDHLSEGLILHPFTFFPPPSVQINTMLLTRIIWGRERGVTGRMSRRRCQRGLTLTT